jgi:hypothetical protein
MIGACFLHVPPITSGKVRNTRGYIPCRTNGLGNRDVRDPIKEGNRTARITKSANFLLDPNEKVYSHCEAFHASTTMTEVKSCVVGYKASGCDRYSHYPLVRGVAMPNPFAIGHKFDCPEIKGGITNPVSSIHPHPCHPM